MLCLNPINAKGTEVGCGQCGPCRVNAVRLKTAQLILESQRFSKSAMATLTYEDEHLPLSSHPEAGSRRFTREEKESRANVKKADPSRPVPTVLKTHLLQIRNALYRWIGRPRYLGVSEYGTKTGRPHYHFLVFGVDALELRNCLQADGWPFGFIHTRPIQETAQMAYVAGYCLKKQTDKRYVPGQEQEAMVYPHRPALGMPTVEFHAHQLFSKAWFWEKDVPKFFRYQGKMWPYSWYQRTRMRKIMGRPPLSCDAEDLEPFHEEKHSFLSLEDRAIVWQKREMRREVYSGKTQNI